MPSTQTVVPEATTLSFKQTLRDLEACHDARTWVGGKTLEQVWAECERGDWLLWLAARAEVDRKLIVKASCACARLGLPYVVAGETRPLRAIEVAEAWAEGKASLEEVRVAGRDARNAAYAAADAAYAAYAAAYAAYAAYAYAAYAAADAAYAAADAAYAAYAAERRRVLRLCADEVRKLITFADVSKALGGVQ